MFLFLSNGGMLDCLDEFRVAWKEAITAVGQDGLEYLAECSYTTINGAGLRTLMR